MAGLPFLIVVAGALAVVAHHAFRNPRGVYLRSAAGVALVTFGWALIWFLAAPSNEAGFGFFAIWVVLVALSLLIAIAACIGATVRHLLGDGPKSHRAWG